MRAPTHVISLQRQLLHILAARSSAAFPRHAWGPRLAAAWRQQHRQQHCTPQQLTNLREVLTDTQPPSTTLPREAFDAELQPSASWVAPPPAVWGDVPELMAGCEPGRAPLKVALLLSGGVDSSLALHLARAAGHHVTAFYLKIWFVEDFRNSWDACPWEDDLAYCKQVCERAGVPLEVVPLSQQYWDRVVQHSVAEIRAGRTPNPDVLCNSRVKFGAFYEHLATHAGAFDRIASGHYARLVRPDHPAAPPVAPTTRGAPAGAACTGVASGGAAASGVVRLQLTPDAVKDQTYFLAHLSQQQLGRAMFPLGCLTKEQVRALARAADLPNKDRKDSQGICFLGKVKFSEFVAEHLGEWPGPIIEADSGQVLGYHRGVWFHTVGQRRGVPLHGGPWYVVAKDVDTNALYVSNRYYEPDKQRNSFRCGDFNWSQGTTPELLRQLSSAAAAGSRRPAQAGGGMAAAAAGASPPLLVKVRHGPGFHTVRAFEFERGGYESAAVRIDRDDQGLAPGQYAAFYHDGVCLGSGVMLQ